MFVSNALGRLAGKADFGPITVARKHCFQQLLGAFVGLLFL
jgi:hypothetical protein